MELADLAIFLEVVDSGSMSEAARRYGRSQPAVSRAIQRLERELGVSLLQRSEAGVVEVLPAGQRLLMAARRIIEEERQLRSDLARLAGELRGLIRIAASTIPAEYLVPPLLASFRARYPQVTSQVLVLDSGQVVARLRRRESDIGFVGDRPEEGPLAFEQMAEDEIVLVVPQEHPFVSRSTVSFAEVVAQPLVLREPGSGTLASLVRALSERGLELPGAGATVVGSTSAQLAAIRAGVGIGFVSSFAAERAEGVATVPVEGLSVRRTLYLAYEPERLETAVVRCFVEFARAWARRDRLSGASSSAFT